jgi:D-serine deaminase-like pyridoxal phosphate-dependent protein
MKRRTFLLGTGAAAIGTAALLRERNEGGPYSPYFAKLNKTLQSAGLAKPSMIIDLDKMDVNIDEVRTSIHAPKTYRIVVKSLPSVPLLQYVMQRANTQALMVFHQPFLNTIADQFPGADVLMGKPQPIATVATFYEKLKATGFNPQQQLQWLIDTPARLKQYQALAQSLGVKMRVALELDIGLHRGGFSDSNALNSTLDIIAADPAHLEFSGFMGYEAHIAKLPRVNTVWREAVERYHGLYKAAKEHQPDLFGDHLTLNIAGSQTYQLYRDDTFFNDLCAGSGLVMPSDFDMPTLEKHQAAAFIATPVLKQYDSVQVAGLEWASGIFAASNPNRQQTFYIYGGNWQASYENPPGLRRNPVWGHSSNQEMVNASNKVTLGIDDFVFLRPHQSEFVFLQFGDLITVRGGEIGQSWPVFQETS